MNSVAFVLCTVLHTCSCVMQCKLNSKHEICGYTVYFRFIQALAINLNIVLSLSSLTHLKDLKPLPFINKVYTLHTYWHPSFSHITHRLFILLFSWTIKGMRHLLSQLLFHSSSLQTKRPNMNREDRRHFHLLFFFFFYQHGSGNRVPKVCPYLLSSHDI